MTTVGEEPDWQPVLDEDVFVAREQSGALYETVDPEGRLPNIEVCHSLLRPLYPRPSARLHQYLVRESTQDDDSPVLVRATVFEDARAMNRFFESISLTPDGWQKRPRGWGLATHLACVADAFADGQDFRSSPRSTSQRLLEVWSKLTTSGVAQVVEAPRCISSYGGIERYKGLIVASAANLELQDPEVQA